MKCTFKPVKEVSVPEWKGIAFVACGKAFKGKGIPLSCLPSSKKYQKGDISILIVLGTGKVSPSSLCDIK